MRGTGNDTMITLTFTLKEAKGLMDGLRDVQDTLEGEFDRGSDIVEDLISMIADKVMDELMRLEKEGI